MTHPPLSLLTQTETSPSASVITKESLLDWIRSNKYPTSHIVGSTRMGVDSESVVDERLQVRGVSNLRVADASVIPAIPNGNVHSTVIAIAYLAAEIILSNKS